MKVHQISHEPKHCMIGLPIVYVNMRTLVYNLRPRTIGNETSIDWLNHRYMYNKLKVLSLTCVLIHFSMFTLGPM